MADKTEKETLPTLSGPLVIQEVIDKVPLLKKQVGPLGHPRAMNGDVVGALIDAATPESAAQALAEYNVKLGRALAEIEARNEKRGDHP